MNLYTKNLFIEPLRKLYIYREVYSCALNAVHDTNIILLIHFSQTSVIVRYVYDQFSGLNKIRTITEIIVFCIPS